MGKNNAKAWLSLAMIFALCLCIGGESIAATLRVGSSGEDVKTLQTKLKRWGYYTGSIDGVFGAGTKKALGMSASGGSGSSSSSGTNTDGNLYLLARLVYGESRGEPYKGQVAVAAVVLNRVKSSQFPNSVSGVIYQSGAFSVVTDGQINLTPDETAIKAARDAMNGYDPTNGCLYYYNPAKTTNQWMLSKPVLLVIGNHSFFK